MRKITNDQFDEFLNNVTHDIADAWQDSTGQILSIEDLYKLNDFLTTFFSPRRKQ